MTLKGKIFAILFFILVGFSAGMFTGYKVFSKPQTVNDIELNVKRLKGNENTNLNFDVKPEANTDNSSKKEKRKNRASNK